MQSFLNFVVFFVLSAFGLSAYFFNPYRSGSLIVGLLLQAFGIAVLFLSTVSQKHALNRYKNAAKDTLQSNRRWLIGSIAAVCISGALLLIGIPYSFLRFILFLLLWAGAIGAGQYLCYFIWRRNNEELAVQLVKEDEEKRAQEFAAQERAKAAAEQMRKDAQERAEAAEAQQRAQRGIEPLAHEIPNSLPVSMARHRVEDLPDLMFAMRLMNGDASAIQEALAHPTRNKLAAIEEVIAQNYGGTPTLFFQAGKSQLIRQLSLEEMQGRLLYLAVSHQLFVNPAWMQELMSHFDSMLQRKMLMLIQKSCTNEDIFAYELIYAQLWLAEKLEKQP